MLDNAVQLANNPWAVIVDMSADDFNALLTASVPNGDRLYLMDTRAGSTLRLR